MDEIPIANQPLDIFLRADKERQDRDRDEFLDQSARILLDLRLDSPMAIAHEDIPF
jgi:hypothetical protein